MIILVVPYLRAAALDAFERLCGALPGGLFGSTDTLPCTGDTFGIISSLSGIAH